MNVTLGRRRVPHRTVSFDPSANAVVLVEQRLLPHRFELVRTRTYVETSVAIKDMVVRGAGAIGATAAYGLAQGARAYRGSDLKKFQKHVAKVYATIEAARPTAVDPVNAMQVNPGTMSAGIHRGEETGPGLARGGGICGRRRGPLPRHWRTWGTAD